MKAYALANGITGGRGISTAAWQAFRDHAMDPKNGLPASGWALLQSDKGDKDRDKARDRFHYLLLDSLKKDRETETKEGLASAKRKRDQAFNVSDEDTPGPIESPTLVVRVVIIDPEDARDQQPMRGNYCWANARNKRLVPLPRITMQELVDGVRARIPNGRIVRAIYGALSTPPPNGQKLADIEG